MSLTRRNFLIRSSFSLAAGAFSSVLVEAKNRKALLPISKTGNQCAGSLNWLLITFISPYFFWLPTQGLCVRPIEQYRARIDANPLLIVEGAIFAQTDENIPLQVCRAIANYIGGDGQDIAGAKHDDRVGSLFIMGCHCAKVTRS